MKKTSIIVQNFNNLTPGTVSASAKYGLAIVIAVALVYGQVYSHEFIDFDDNQYIFDNPRVKSGLSIENIHWAFTTDHGSNWHPVTWISLMADCHFFGLNPGATHLINVALHMANAVLLLILLIRMTGEAGKSAFVAALFALHPIHVESVAWAVERKDVLSTFFWFFTTHAYLSWIRARSARRYLVMALFFAFGLMTKPMLVTLPCTLLLLDYWPLERLEISVRSLASRIVEKLPLFLLVAGSCVMTLLFEHRGAGMPLTVLPIEWRIGNAFTSYLLYVKSLFWPVGFALVYPHPMKDLSGGAALLSIAVVIVVTSGAIASMRRTPWFAVGWVWYIGTLVPVIGIVQVGVQAMADRYAYVPFIGLYIALAWAGSCVPKKPRIILAVFLLAALSLATARQTAFWQNSERIFSKALENTTGNWLMENALGSTHVRKGRFDDALPHFERSGRIMSDVPMTRYSLGLVHYFKGDFSRAESEFRRALAMDSVYVSAHNGLGKALIEQGRLDEAMAHFNEAMRLDPGNSGAIAAAGKVLLRKERFDEAEMMLRVAIAADPYRADPYASLAFVTAKRGRLSDAVPLFEKALAIDSLAVTVRHNFASALVGLGRTDRAIDELRTTLQIDSRAAKTANDLAWLLATTTDASLRNGPEALRLAQLAIAERGETDARFLDTLSAAYAENLLFDSAVRFSDLAYERAVLRGDSVLAVEVGARRRLFLTKSPYRR